MIRSTDRLREIDRHHTSTVVARRTYAEALAIFSGMWAHARQLNPTFPDDWAHDVEADIELARVLNGLPPRE
jgi:hypothetical protein